MNGKKITYYTIQRCSFVEEVRGHDYFTMLAQISLFPAYAYVIESILVSFHNLQFFNCH